MGRTGQRLRIGGHAKCTLHLDGLDYHGEIEDISLGGALVRLNNWVPSRVRPGSTCGLQLCSTQGVEYICRVARIGPTVVGVQILDFHYGETTH